MTTSDPPDPGTPVSGGAGRFSQTSASRAQEDLSSDRLLNVLARDGQGRPLLGRIALICRLGKGGMGAVYYGIHPRLQVEVAIKVLPFNLVEQDPKLVDRFISEARMAAALASDHVVRVLDVDSDRETHFLVMEYVAGETAGAYLKRTKIEGRPALDEQEALEIVTGATKGLAAAHERGIIHRDVKPDNILIPGGNRRKSKLADLGLAKPEGGGLSLGTASHIAMGTPGYMAPEQAEDAKTAGPAADVFSMGATLYALLSGKAPFVGSSLAVILRDTAVKDPGPLPASVGAGTRALVERCLAKDPKRRYASGAELLSALEGLQGGLPTPVTIPQAIEPTLMPMPQGTAPRRRGWVLPVAAAAVLLVGGAIYVATRPGGKVPPTPPVHREDTARKAAEEKERAEKISEAHAKADKGDLDGAVTALEGLTGTEPESLRVDWTRRSKEQKDRAEKVGGILKQVESLEKDSRWDSALAVLTQAETIDSDDPRVRKARGRIEEKIRSEKTVEERRKSYAEYLKAARSAKLLALGKDASEAWQAVAEGAALAEANASDEMEKKEARELGSLGAQRRDWAKAREIEASDLNGAVDLTTKAVAAREAPKELLEFHSKLVGLKKVRDEREARKRVFDQLAAKALADKNPVVALELWREAEKSADEQTDKAEAKKRVAELSTEVALLAEEARRQKEYDVAMAEGREAETKEDFDKARNAYERALAAKRKDGEANSGLARVETARRQKAYDTAMKDGQAAFEAGDLDTAASKFGEAVKMKETDATAKSGLAKVEAARRLKAYEAAIKNGEAALAAEKFDEAEAKFKEALVLEPGDAHALDALSRTNANRAAKGPVKYLLAFKPRQGDQITETTVLKHENENPFKSTKKWITTYDSVESDRVTKKTVIVERWDSEMTILGKATTTVYVPANSKCTVRLNGETEVVEGDIPEVWWKSFNLKNDFASILPKGRVAVGESWDASEAMKGEMPKNAGFTYTTLEVKITLKDVVEVQGRKCATLDMHIKSAYNGTGFSGESTGDSRYVMWLDRGYALSGQSTTFSTTKTGDKSSKTTMTIETAYEVKEGPGQGK